MNETRTLADLARSAGDTREPPRATRTLQSQLRDEFNPILVGTKLLGDWLVRDWLNKRPTRSDSPSNGPATTQELHSAKPGNEYGMTGQVDK